MEKVVQAPDIKVGDVVWQRQGMEATTVLSVDTFTNFKGQTQYRVVMGNSRGISVTMEMYPENNLTYSVPEGGI